MNINTRNLGFVNFNNEEMQWVKFNGVTVYESFKNLIASGVPPLTLLNCKGVDLVDYKIYGNSKQESENLFDKTTMLSGFIPTSGSYPTTNSAYLNARYQIIEMKAGQTFRITPNKEGDIYGRIRYIDNDTNQVVGQIDANSTQDYYVSTVSQNNGFYSGEITAKKDLKLGIMYLINFPSDFDLQVISIAPTPEAPIEVESVGDKTKNLFQDISIVGGSNTTYTNGTITQKVADTSTGIQFKLQAYKDLSFLYHIVSKSITNLGVFCLSFTKEDTFNQICFGLNGTARDTTIIIDVSTLENGKTYTISANMLNITQGTVSWNNIQIEEAENLVNENNLIFDNVWTIENNIYTSMNNSYQNLEFKNITIEKGKTYILSCEVLVPNKNYYYRLRSGTINVTTPVNVTQTGKRSLTFTATESYTDVKLQCFGLSNSSGEFSFTKPQLIEENIDKEYEPYGYKIPVKARGKNLLDLSQDLILWNTIKLEDNQSFQSAINNQYYAYIKIKSLNDYLMEQKGKKITFSISEGIPNKKLSIVIYGKRTSTTNQFQEASNNFGERSVTITIADDFTEITEFEMRFNRASTPFTDTTTIITGLQLELGEATRYEPYQEPITTNIYLNEPLRKIGDYADYIDFENSRVVRKIYHEYLTGITAKSSVQGTYSIFLTDISATPIIVLNAGNSFGYAMSNKFKQSDVNYLNMVHKPNMIQSYITSAGVNRVAFTFDDSSINTIPLAQEKIGNGFDVYYAIINAIKEPIELPNIPTIKGTTILEVDTEIQPSNMEVVYKGKK